MKLCAFASVLRGVGVLCVGTALALITSGCEKKEPPKASGPVEVGVVTLKAQPIPVSTELPGRTSAYLTAQVRARVDGIVTKRLFQEGANVP